MRSATKWITYIQIAAAIGLGIAYFLPLYQTYGLLGKVHYAENAWILFFWTIPAFVLIHLASNRWLKSALCILAALVAIFDLAIPITFLATYKSTPLIGYHIAKVSIIVLSLGWLALIVVSLSPQKQVEKTS